MPFLSCVSLDKSHNFSEASVFSNDDDNDGGGVMITKTTVIVIILHGIIVRIK